MRRGRAVWLFASVVDLCAGLTVVLILCIAVAVGLFIFIAGLCVIQRSERHARGFSRLLGPLATVLSGQIWAIAIGIVRPSVRPSLRPFVSILSDP